MNEIIKAENYFDQLYQIIGSESQVLQLVLLPHQYILTSNKLINYFSPNLTTTFKQDWIDYGILNTIIENNTAYIGYIGLSNQFSGKISVLKIIKNSELLIRSDKIIAATENCKFSFYVNKSGYSNYGSQKDSFSLCKPQRFEFPNEIKKNMICDPFKAHTDFFNFDHESGMNCYVYLQSESNLLIETSIIMEKELKENERINAF